MCVQSLKRRKKAAAVRMPTRMWWKSLGVDPADEAGRAVLLSAASPGSDRRPPQAAPTWPIEDHGLLPDEAGHGQLPGSVGVRVVEEVGPV